MSKKIAKTSLFFLLLTACQQQPSTLNSPLSSTNVIYGEDGRQDLYQIENPSIIKYARATVAFIAPAHLSLAADGFYDLVGNTYGMEQGLCEGEKFAEQKTTSDCSGFLVAPDIVVTAGHCAHEALTHKIVFDYLSKADGVSLERISKDQVYETKKILKSVDQPLQNLDFTIIQLDRPVLDREPLKLRSEGNIQVGEAVILIGSPLGIPLKVDLGGKVRSLEGETSFKTTTDSYNGNSGSPVINARSGEVEGILSDGETDLDYDDVNKCYVSKHCLETECRGEGVTKIQQILPYLPLSASSDLIFQANLD